MPKDTELPQLYLTPLRINVTWHFAAALPPRQAALIRVHLLFDICRRTKKTKGGRNGG